MFISYKLLVVESVGTFHGQILVRRLLEENFLRTVVSHKFGRQDIVDPSADFRVQVCNKQSSGSDFQTVFCGHVLKYPVDITSLEIECEPPFCLDPRPRADYFRNADYTIVCNEVNSKRSSPYAAVEVISIRSSHKVSEIIATRPPSTRVEECPPHESSLDHQATARLCGTAHHASFFIFAGVMLVHLRRR